MLRGRLVALMATGTPLTHKHTTVLCVGCFQGLAACLFCSRALFVRFVVECTASCVITEH